MTERSASAGVPAPLATTILLLRDGAAGLEVLMVTRHAATVFAGGALVFPGGRVDPDDGAPETLARCRPVEGLAPAEMALRVAGIRETFEEAHVLLARVRGETGLITAPALATLEAGLAGSLGHPPVFADLLASGAIELATDRLVPYAHWITPVGRPKRFDTYFFLAEAPSDQQAIYDGHEAVAAAWFTPSTALAEAAAERARLIFVTKVNLMRLGESGDTTAAALAAAKARPVVAICPEVFETPAGWRIRISADSGYGAIEMPTYALKSGGGAVMS